MGRPRKPRRRGRGEGTVFEKTTTRTNKDGSKVTKTVWVAKTSGAYRKEFTGATATEARETRDAWLREHGRPVPRSARAEPITVAQFAKVFLEHRKRNRRPATYRDYENTFRNHIEAAIGNVKMHELNDDQVRALYRQVEAGASPSMARRVHGVLRAILNYAIEAKVIRSTPLAVIRQDVPRWKRKPIRPLTEKQVETLFEVCKDHRLGALFVLAVDSGARQGELFGLQWDDVDFDRRTVYIRRQVVRGLKGEGLYLDDLKTTHSRRRIEISPETVEWLRRRKAMALKEGLGDCVLAFPSPRGGLLHKTYFIQHMWMPLRKKAGIPNVRFHDLRHTCAVMLLIEGVNPKIVQQRLGHASIKLTLDTYASWLPDLQAEAAQAVSRVFGRIGRRRKVRRAA